MNTQLIALALFGLTAAAVAYYPTLDGQVPAAGPDPAAQMPAADPASNQRPVVDVVFALDTTGSMGGLVAADGRAALVGLGQQNPHAFHQRGAINHVSSRQSRHRIHSSAD